MTTIRLTEAEVAEMIRSGAMLLTADLRDRFGDSGTIAYLQIRKLDGAWTIENWLMSCRILGRTIEGQLLNHVLCRARRANVHTLYAAYVPTVKNAPFADFYPANGFNETETGVNGEKRYALRLAEIERAGPRESFIEVMEG
jgi:FkbH-like protein